MFNYWTMDAYFIITLIWVSGTVLNWFIREKKVMTIERKNQKGGKL